MGSSTGVRVLFTGQYWPGANSLYIARAFERCGAIVRFLNETALFPAWETKRGRIARRLLTPLIEAEWNRQLLALVHTFQPDLVYITNAHFCWRRTLEAIRAKNIPVMCFYHDVKWVNREGSRFSKVIDRFDLVATTRHWHEAEFKAAGARNVKVVRFGYEPSVHRPLQLEEKAMKRYGADVTFIGTMELHRRMDLQTLLSREFPYQFRLWGNSWENIPLVSAYWQGRDVHEQEIPVIYAASKVALHWVGWEPHGSDKELQKGDQHNSRTFQIAACGGALMLAQRTEEHIRLFEEDKEAVFFDDVTELREKLDYWLAPHNDVKRKKVAQAARERCLNEDYSWMSVTRLFLEFFGFPCVSSRTDDKT
ncbi:MAG: glycosyltransferase [Chloroflexi bacterium]|nr:glycosyltransferase [Chloroflexota bacterium]